MTTAATQRAWPGATLARVPYWVYQDEANYQRRAAPHLRGPAWNYVCLEADIAAAGRLPHHVRGRDAGDRGRAASDGEIHAFENRCAHRGALIALDDGGTAEALPVRLSRVELRPARQPRSASPSRRASSGLGGMPESFCKAEHGPRKLRTTTLGGLVFASLSRRRAARSRSISAPEMLGRARARAARARRGARPLRAGAAQQLEALRREREGHVPREPAPRLLRHVPHHAPHPGRRRAREPRRRRTTRATRSTAPTTARAPPIAIRASARSKRAIGSPIRACSTPSTSSATTSSCRSSRVFPGLVVQQIHNCLAVRQVVPKGPDAMELHWTYFGFADDTPEMRRRRLRQAEPGRPRGLRLDGGRLRGRLRPAWRRGGRRRGVRGQHGRRGRGVARRRAPPRPRCAASGRRTGATWAPDVTVSAGRVAISCAASQRSTPTTRAPSTTTASRSGPTSSPTPCLYKITSAENHRLGLPAGLMYADSRGMLERPRDRAPRGQHLRAPGATATWSACPPSSAETRRRRARRDAVPDRAHHARRRHGSLRHRPLPRRARRGERRPALPRARRRLRQQPHRHAARHSSLERE